MKASPFRAPTVGLELAARCPVARHVRDHQLGRWCGVPPQEFDDFIEHLADYDTRAAIRAREEKRARRRREIDRLQQDDLLADLRQHNIEWGLREQLRVRPPSPVPYLTGPVPHAVIPDPYYERLVETYAVNS